MRKAWALCLLAAALAGCHSYFAEDLTDPAIKARVLHEFKADPELDLSKVDVDVHAGVVTDWPRGINSRMRGGVQEIDISKEYPAAVVLRHASCIGNPELGRKVADEAVKLLGGKYDNWANLKFAFPVLYIWMRMLCHGVLNVSKLNCIGLAVQCLRSAGLKIGWYLPTEAITPGMGFMDENMHLVTDEGAICRNMNTRAVTPEFVRAVYRKL